MPSDALTITIALASPTVAGFVALAIHRQRLDHERRQADLAVMRQVLATGAALVVEILEWSTVRISEMGVETMTAAEGRDVAAVLAEYNVSLERPEVRQRVMEDARAFRSRWLAWSAELTVLLPEQHPLVKASSGVYDGLVALRKALALGEPVASVAPEGSGLDMACQRWLREARQVGHAIL